MATTINNYRVGLTLDAGQYIKSSELSRTETNKLKREINNARTPMENYERDIGTLKKALNAGAISQGTYNRLLENAKTKLDNAQASAEGATGAIGAAGKAFGVWAIGLTSIATIRRGLGALRREMLELDNLAKKARGINETVNNLQAFQLAASEIAGVDGPQAIELLSKLTRKVGEFQLGMGEGKKALGEVLKFAPADFQGKSPVELFAQIQERISKMQDPLKQIAVTTKLFESEGKALLPMLKDQTFELSRYLNVLEAYGVLVDDDTIARTEAFNDAVGRLGLGGTGLYRKTIDFLTGGDDVSSQPLGLTGVLFRQKLFSNFLGSQGVSMSTPSASSSERVPQISDELAEQLLEQKKTTGTGQATVLELQRLRRQMQGQPRFQRVRY